MKRYKPGAYGAMVEDEDGKYVHVDDLEPAVDRQGEIERLKKALADHCIQCPQCHDSIRAVLEEGI